MVNQKTDRLIEQCAVRPDFDFGEMKDLIREEVAGGFGIMCGKNEVVVATEGLHRRGDGLRQEADA